MSTMKKAALATVINADELASVAREGVQRALACRKQAVELSAEEIAHVSGATIPVITDLNRFQMYTSVPRPITIGLQKIVIATAGMM